MPRSRCILVAGCSTSALDGLEISGAMFRHSDIVGGLWQDAEGLCGEGVNVHRGGRHRDSRRAVRESLGMSVVRGVGRALAGGADDFDAVEEDISWGEEREAGMMVLVVVLCQRKKSWR